MFRFGPFKLIPFRRRRRRFEAAVVEELDYLRGAFGDNALARGIERASRDHISERRREVIKEAVRRLGGHPSAERATP